MIAVGAVVTAALAWIGWVLVFQARPMVDSELVTFEVVDESSAEATIQVVRRNEGVTASCLLRAQAADHSIVGELNFDVDASSPASTTLTRTVRTYREATTVILLGCLADGQPRRR